MRPDVMIFESAFAGSSRVDMNSTSTPTAGSPPASTTPPTKWLVSEYLWSQRTVSKGERTTVKLVLG
jgi:hypothetical protein